MILERGQRRCQYGVEKQQVLKSASDHFLLIERREMFIHVFHVDLDSLIALWIHLLVE